ncbi:hypothetical protein AB4Y90_03715 [Chryseobacterium sp. 2TAF14]|uniref:hypothetical protein n=1 Tax=Chryseobacterium sp. 2TAF14 TaxID=3233007 RepID=UPI003F8FABDE
MKVLFVILISLLSCSAKKTEQVFGVYVAPEYNYINKLKYGNFIPQLTLKLNEDYTYEYLTCAQIEKGKWKLTENRLELYCEEKKFILDSINSNEKYKKGKICSPLQTFSYSKDKIQQNIVVQNKDFKLLLLKE